tara:strand:+ start:288 stop:443 length:156 start_codon:yes stop_codon:yes gene_type:complete
MRILTLDRDAQRNPGGLAGWPDSWAAWVPDLLAEYRAAIDDRMQHKLKAAS